MWFLTEPGRFFDSRQETPPGSRESGGVTHEKAPKSLRTTNRQEEILRRY